MTNDTMQDGACMAFRSWRLGLAVVSLLSFLLSLFLLWRGSLHFPFTFPSAVFVLWDIPREADSSMSLRRLHFTQVQYIYLSSCNFFFLSQEMELGSCTDISFVPSFQLSCIHPYCTWKTVGKLSGNDIHLIDRQWAIPAQKLFHRHGLYASIFFFTVDMPAFLLFPSELKKK